MNFLCLEGTIACAAVVWDFATHAQSHRHVLILFKYRIMHMYVRLKCITGMMHAFQPDARTHDSTRRVRAPIVMTLSGGYAPKSAEVISRSLSNVMRTFKLARPLGRVV